MKKQRRAGVFFAYLKHHKKSFGLVFLFAVLFFVVLSLYNLPLEAVLYWALLCLFFGGVAVGVDFRSYLKRHRELVRLRKEITLGVVLPEPKNLMEEDYISLINILNENRVAIGAASEQKARDLEDYYTIWAHQIKTPIAALRLLLRAREDSSELYPELFKIEQYVDMVLQYMRFESTTTDYYFKKQQLDPIVRQAAKKFAPLFVSKKIALKIDLLKIKVLTDEKWLAFVLEQILSNALKYTQTGTIFIYLEGKDTLVVRDTGVGIAPEDLPRICEKSYTGLNGREDKRATGLGLYLCRMILDKLGHRLKIASKLGEGTTVKITFEDGKL